MPLGRTNSGAGNLPPNPCYNISAKVGDKQIILKWNDPNNTVYQGRTIVEWKNTIVRMSTDHIPTTPNDGTLVVDNTVRNQYSINGYTVGGLINGVTYYFSFFPYSDKGIYNEDYSIQNISAIPKKYGTFTVKIDQSNSNPETSCTYADDAIGMTAGSSEWDAIFGERPCLFKNGQVVKYLNPNDFTKDVDGNTVDITSGNSGDVMIEFPRLDLKIETVGNIVTVSMTNNLNQSGFYHYAHQRGNIDKEYFYLGAYKGYYDGSKLRSLSGKQPTTNKTIGTFRTYAHNNGAGYEQSGFHQLIYRQAMYVLKYKNLNSQSAVGMGYVGASSANTTGNTNQNGMTYGTTSSTQQMKLFGLEDFLGNIYEWIDGLYTNNSYHILVGTDNFNDSGTGYTDFGQGTSSILNGYMNKSQGGIGTGFIIKQSNGSASTYYCDYAVLGASSLPYFGGHWSDGSNAGAFPLVVNLSASSAYSSIGARLMYL